MAEPQATSANHHYVPKFVLRNFATSATGNKLLRYDKASGRVDKQAPKHAASRSGFNAHSDGTASLEAALSREIETPAARAVGRLITGEFPTALSPREESALRKLLVAQALRTPRARRIADAFVRATPELAGRFALEADGSLGIDGQLDFAAMLLEHWRVLGPGVWPLRLREYASVLVPDNGVVLHHPGIATRGWVDEGLNDMASALMPLTPTLVLAAENPKFSDSESLPDDSALTALTWGQADEYIYGSVGSRLRERLSIFRMPPLPRGANQPPS